MKIKTLLSLVLLVVGLVGLMWWGKSVPRPVSGVPGVVAAAKGTLVTPERLYDFGTISMASGKVAGIFKVSNPTDQDITIKSVVTSCMCTTAYLESKDGEKGPFGMPGHGGPVAEVTEVIRAGESRTIRVVYDPNAHGPAGVGLVDRFIYLTEASGGVLELEIKAVVTP